MAFHYIYPMYFVLGLAQAIGCMISRWKITSDPEKIVHPRKIITSVVGIQYMSCLRFLCIGLIYLLTLGNNKYTPYNNKDFGFIPFSCKLEGMFSYMLLITNILWNTFWSYDLYLSVKKPMVYSENYYNFYWKLVYAIGISCGIFAFFINSFLESSGKNTICIMNSGALYTLFVTLPLIVSITLNLYINLKYGRDSYLKKFSQNYTRFKLIFGIQRIYFISWTITMIPSMMHSLVDKGYILALQPSCILICVLISWREKHKLKRQQMLKEGFVEKLKMATNRNMSIGDFKEVIRKEVVGKIANAIDQVYSESVNSSQIMAFDGINDNNAEDSDEFEDFEMSDEEEGKVDASPSRESDLGSPNKGRLIRKSTIRK